MHIFKIIKITVVAIILICLLFSISLINAYSKDTSYREVESSEKIQEKEITRETEEGQEGKKSEKNQETQIIIDGDPSDLDKYEVLMTDLEGDNRQGNFDITSFKAFANDKFLYILIETYSTPEDFVQIDYTIS